MIDIINIDRTSPLEDVLNLIRKSYKTEADKFGLTPGNAPTNPAFITMEQLREYLEKNLVLFGLRNNGSLIGCVAVEKAADKEGCYYIERLAVLPEERHNGYGRRLLDHAVEVIKRDNGTRAEIGIIDEHEVLKQWYIEYGFTVTGRKQFEHLPFDVCFLALDL